MKKLRPSKRLKSHLYNLWRRDVRCVYCGRQTHWLVVHHNNRLKLPLYVATIDHPNRREYGNGVTGTVLSCYGCNNERSRHNK